MGYLRKVLGVTLRDKVHRFEIRKARDQATSLNREISAILVGHVSRMSHERMANYVLRATVCTHGKAAQWSSKDQGCRD